MNIFAKMYCRVYQTIFKWAIPLMPYREPQILDSVLDVKNILVEKNITKVLLVTDQGIKNLKLTDTLEKDLKQANIDVVVFDETVPNPTIQNIENGLKKYLENDCQGIIAFGGGSVMDCAKVIGARVVCPKKTVPKMKGLLKIRKPLPTLIAIPTTAGTGSETTIAAVISDPENKLKYPINDFNLIPHYAVLDPSLTIGLPPHLTSTTGMDALTHAIEAYIGNSTTKYTRHNSLEACRLIFENIEKAYTDGSNERARRHMLKGSYLAGLSFTISYVGYVHAIAHSLGGFYGTAHGLANAVILPYMLSEYGESIYGKLKDIAVYCNIARPYDNKQIASSKLINRILEMNDNMKIPKRFDFIKEEDIPLLAKHASSEANPLYPVPKLLNARELEKIYYKISSVSLKN